MLRLSTNRFRLLGIRYSCSTTSLLPAVALGTVGYTPAVLYPPKRNWEMALRPYVGAVGASIALWIDSKTVCSFPAK